MGQRIGFFKLSILVIMLFTTVVAGTAQELCEELSREIFEDTDENCSEASNENACYGFDSISATFFDEISDNFSGPVIYWTCCNYIPCILRLSMKN